MKTVIITGGWSGIGLAITELFFRSGYKTIIIGRNEEKLSEVKDRLGENCSMYVYDLNEVESIPGLVKNIIEGNGNIDVLINNASINMKKDFWEVTDDDFQKIMHTNVTSVFSLSREVIKAMLANNIKGSIIDISSMASRYGIPRVIAYSASKSAIEGMTRAMATELSGQGIRVNCIAPGFIATDMSAKALNNDPERKAKALNRTPMGFMGQPRDVAEAALFLAGDASKYVTGTIIPVDGGNSIGF